MLGEPLKGEPRELIAEALHRYMASTDDFEGVVTGYVVAFEVTPLSGVPALGWFSGDGFAPSEGDDRSTATHRIDGMLRGVQRALGLLG